MANTNAPFGARVWSGTGAAANYQIEVMKVSSADTTKIYQGDFVKRLSTGYVAQWTNGTAVSQLGGIFDGCLYLSTSLGIQRFSRYWPGADATGDVTAFIIPANLATPLQVVMQCDSTGAAFADVGSNCDVTVGTGSTVTGLSGALAAIASATTTATLPLRLLKLYADVAGTNTVPGSQSGAYNWGIFALNTSGAGSTGI